MDIISQSKECVMLLQEIDSSDEFLITVRFVVH